MAADLKLINIPRVAYKTKTLADLLNRCARTELIQKSQDLLGLGPGNPDLGSRFRGFQRLGIVEKQKKWDGAVITSHTAVYSLL